MHDARNVPRARDGFREIGILIASPLDMKQYIVPHSISPKQFYLANTSNVRREFSKNSSSLFNLLNDIKNPVELDKTSKHLEI